jgi:hypothetical protein
MIEILLRKQRPTPNFGKAKVMEFFKSKNFALGIFEAGKVWEKARRPFPMQPVFPSCA